MNFKVTLKCFLLGGIFVIFLIFSPLVNSIWKLQVTTSFYMYVDQCSMHTTPIKWTISLQVIMGIHICSSCSHLYNKFSNICVRNFKFYMLVYLCTIHIHTNNMDNIAGSLHVGAMFVLLKFISITPEVFVLETSNFKTFACICYAVINKEGSRGMHSTQHDWRYSSLMSSYTVQESFFCIRISLAYE